MYVLSCLSIVVSPSAKHYRMGSQHTSRHIVAAPMPRRTEIGTVRVSVYTNLNFVMQELCVMILVCCSFVSLYSSCVRNAFEDVDR